MNDKLKQFFNKTSGREKYILSEESKAKVKDRIFANLGTQIVEDVPVSGWKKIINLFTKTYVLVPLVVIVFISTTTIASADALPGEPLYTVKRQVESAQIFLAPTDEAKFDLQVKFAQKRLLEDELLKSDEPVDETENTKNQNEMNAKEVQDENQEQNNTIKQNEKAAADKAELAAKKVEEIKRLHREKARQQADDAVKFLDDARQRLQQKGNEDGAKRIQENINRYTKFRNNNSLNTNQGNVKGEKTEIKVLDQKINIGL